MGYLDARAIVRLVVTDPTLKSSDGAALMRFIIEICKMSFTKIGSVPMLLCLRAVPLGHAHALSVGSKREASEGEDSYSMRDIASWLQRVKRQLVEEDEVTIEIPKHTLCRLTKGS